MQFYIDLIPYYISESDPRLNDFQKLSSRIAQLQVLFLFLAMAYLDVIRMREITSINYWFVVRTGTS